MGFPTGRTGPKKKKKEEEKEKRTEKTMSKTLAKYRPNAELPITY